jgi:MFS family permease
MWELYAFWTFVPLLLALNNAHSYKINISFWSFLVIAIGAVSCVAGGYISQKSGSARVAFWSLIISGACCVVSFLFIGTSLLIFLPFMLLWGITVIADSPQFSALVAQTAPPEYKGTALTFVTSAGFAITILSIQLLNYLLNRASSPTANFAFVILCAGPLTGLLFLYRLIKKK